MPSNSALNIASNLSNVKGLGVRRCRLILRCLVPERFPVTLKEAAEGARRLFLRLSVCFMKYVTSVREGLYEARYAAMRIWVVKYGSVCAVMFAGFFLLGVAGVDVVSLTIGSVSVGEMMRSNTESSTWKRWRLFTMRREKSRVPNWPDTTGSTKGRQSRMAQLLKLMRSRPVCFESES